MRADGAGAYGAELAWFKSSYSAGDGGDCVEVALAWGKSSYSSGGGGKCVEVASCPSTIHVRDSKDVARAGLTFAPSAWTTFVGLVSEV
ncbi:DUF397 domain-containing protein [Streptomyces halstedii]|uniref:DUF397 domain-containing protein n=1 Tax=Streptomyces TaxID=1883 RepID=UPI0004A9035E|nr:DUF397 domain-containing protein [Streptomyces sp. NTK 937]KDQ70601.1 toxin [Streptomyces sp. NTK 937]WSX34980.1 DUF397 domain-containing protein [Streptomyces halstedii]